MNPSARGPRNRTQRTEAQDDKDRGTKPRNKEPEAQDKGAAFKANNQIEKYLVYLVELFSTKKRGRRIQYIALFIVLKQALSKRLHQPSSTDQTYPIRGYQSVRTSVQMCMLW